MLGVPVAAEGSKPRLYKRQDRICVCTGVGEFGMPLRPVNVCDGAFPTISREHHHKTASRMLIGVRLASRWIVILELPAPADNDRLVGVSLARPASSG